MTPLGEIIRAEIVATGPMRLDRYMALCLGHPEHGYYATRDPLGRDFTTSPEISQMFGELIGLWGAEVWAAMGAPEELLWIELGPGRGTLTADALRAARVAPGFAAALRVWFVETSPALRAAQSRTVPAARHATRLAEVPPGPAVTVANEFFDALPIRQLIRREGAWRERMVALAGEGLGWALGPPRPDGPPRAPEGAVWETSPQGRAVAAEIGERLAAAGGAALIVDYGGEPRPEGGGDTLQAMAAGAHVDPLAAPGEADLTAHVDFRALAKGLAAVGAQAWPLTTQAALLNALGIEARAAALARAAPGRSSEIAAAARRLTAPDQMGTLFKALAATVAGQPAPPGFGG